MSDFARILVTTDFSAQSLPGVEEARSLAQALHSRVVLLFVVEDRLPPILGIPSDAERQEILEGYRQRATEEMTRYTERHLAGCQVETAAVVGVAAREIVTYAKDHAIDLIVMASHGYGPIRQLLLGSTAERVLHHSPCPVLIIPSKGG